MARKNKYDPFVESAEMNNLTYIYHLNRYRELSISTINYKNMPDTVNIRYMEQVLFDQGRCVLYDEPGIGLVAMMVTPIGPLDIYREPIKRRAYAANGVSTDLTPENSVIIYNNMLRQPSVMTARIFAKRLAECDRTIDVNIKAQKTPVLIKCNPDQELTLKNMYMKYDGNQPFIFAYKDSLTGDEFDVTNTGAPFIADKTLQIRRDLWSDALASRGIMTTPYAKKERLTATESNQAAGAAMYSRYSLISERERGIEAVNKMFGTNIRVYFEDPSLEEVKLDGDIYDEREDDMRESGE